VSLLDLLFVGGEVRTYTAGRGQMQVDPNHCGQYDAATQRQGDPK